jgi:hypothetical protein
METHIDRKKATEFVKEINNELVKCPILMVPENTYFQLVGTAFDYYFRWLLGPLDLNIVAVKGAYLSSLVLHWEDAAAVVTQVLIEGNSQNVTERRRAQCAIVLAWFEAIYRSLNVPPEIEAVTTLPSENLPMLMEELYARTPNTALEDILQLAASIPQVWEEAIEIPFILNPTFAGSLDIGGADADWITDGILYDCKCSKQARPFERETLLQALGYVLLDYDDFYTIHSIGWYYARQQIRIVRSLATLLPRLFGTSNLAELRQSFATELRVKRNNTPQVVQRAKMSSVIEVSIDDLNTLLREAASTGSRIYKGRMGGLDLVYAVTSPKGITKCYRLKHTDGTSHKT